MLQVMGLLILRTQRMLSGRASPSKGKESLSSLPRSLRSVQYWADTGSGWKIAAAGCPFPAKAASALVDVFHFGNHTHTHTHSKTRILPTFTFLTSLLTTMRRYCTLFASGTHALLTSLASLPDFVNGPVYWCWERGQVCVRSLFLSFVIAFWSPPPASAVVL